MRKRESLLWHIDFVQVKKRRNSPAITTIVLWSISDCRFFLHLIWYFADLFFCFLPFFLLCNSLPCNVQQQIHFIYTFQSALGCLAVVCFTILENVVLSLHGHRQPMSRAILRNERRRRRSRKNAFFL